MDASSYYNDYCNTYSEYRKAHIAGGVCLPLGICEVMFGTAIDASFVVAGSVFEIVLSLVLLCCGFSPKKYSSRFIGLYKACSAKGLTKVETDEEKKLELLIAKTLSNERLVSKVQKHPGKYFNLGKAQALKIEAASQIQNENAQKEKEQKNRAKIRKGVFAEQEAISRHIGADKYITQAKRDLIATKEDLKEAKKFEKAANAAMQKASITQQPNAFIRGAVASAVAGDGVGSYVANKTEKENEKARKEAYQRELAWAGESIKASKSAKEALGKKISLENTIKGVRSHMNCTPVLGANK